MLSTNVRVTTFMSPCMQVRTSYFVSLRVSDELLVNGFLMGYVHPQWLCLQNPSRGVTRAEGHVFVDVFRTAGRPALLSLSCEAGRT